jgi:hypothetical protein
LPVPQALSALQAHERHLVSELSALEAIIAGHPRPTLLPEGPFLNCMSRDHMKVELAYVRSALQILANPAKAALLSGFFAINDTLCPVDPS